MNMHATDFKSLIETAAPVSPDRKYSLAWSWKGRLGILTMKDGEPLLTFREEHGAILRAGFSPDMLQLVAENEDRRFSVWYTAGELEGQKCAETGNIVDFMSNNNLVPCLNITPGLKAYRYELTLRDFSRAAWYYFNWENYYCEVCAWHKPIWNPGLGRHEARCSLPTGCEFKHKEGTT